MLSIFNLSGGTAQSGRSHCSIQAESLLNFAGRADFAERRTHNKQPLRRWVQQEYLPKMLFAIYLVVLAKITIIPGSAFFSAGPYVFTQDTLVIYFGIGLSTMNLLPFKSVLDAFDHGFFYGLYHNVGNIAMLVPFGYMLRAIYKKVNANRIIVYAIVLSLFIEFVQFFEARSVDIDDVILNTIGAALGVILYELIVGKKAILKKRTL